MSNELANRRGEEVGREVADMLINRRLRATGKRGTVTLLEAAGPGLIFALGDSWFDFFFHDLRDSLEDDHAYETGCVARAGTSLKDIAYPSASSSRQLYDLSGLIEAAKKAKRLPKAILLSAGGNDVVGDRLEFLLNPAATGLPPLNEDRLKSVVDGDMRTALVAILTQITAFCRTFLKQPVPIVLHGYDYPVPDGRGVLGHFGRWLAPAFEAQGYQDIALRKTIMVDLIDRLHRMQTDVAGSTGFEHVGHVDLRGSLSTDPADYKKWWENELHPRREGFERLADKLASHLAKLPSLEPLS